MEYYNEHTDISKKHKEKDISHLEGKTCSNTNIE